MQVQFLSVVTPPLAAPETTVRVSRLLPSETSTQPGMPSGPAYAPTEVRPSTYTPPEVRPPTFTPMREIVKAAIILKLQECGGNRIKTAHCLNIGIRTLQRHIRIYRRESPEIEVLRIPTQPQSETL